MLTSLVYDESVVDLIEFSLFFSKFSKYFVLEEVLITAFSPKNVPLLKSILGMFST